MFETIERDGERGQVGIGTLIVFIALVLVAAIAAGVLINTAGFLQSQAESTGQESTQQVSDRVQVDSIVGVDTNGDGTLERVDLTVSLAPGADAIQLEDATYQYLNNQTATFDGSNDDLTFKNLGGTAGETLLDDGSTRVIEFNLDGSNGLGSADLLDAGESVEITISTATGSETVVEGNVPSPLQTDSSDEAVRL